MKLLLIGVFIFLFFILEYILRILRIEKKNPLSLFLGWWAIWVFVTIINPYKLKDISYFTYFLVGLNILSFSLGFILLARKRQKFVFDIKDSHKDIFFMVVNTMLFFALVHYLRKYNYLLSTMSILDSRKIKYELGLLFSNYYEYVFFTYVIKPFLYISILRQIILVLNKHHSKVLTLLVILNIALFGLIGQGRLIVFEIMIYIWIARSIFVKTKNYNHIKIFKGIVKKVRREYFYFGGVLIVIFIAMFYLTISRLGLKNNSNINYLELILLTIKQGIVYFTGCFNALDNFIVGEKFKLVGFTYGMATFGGLEEIIYNMTIILGLNYNIINQKIATITINPIQIGENIEYNAFYTGIMNFYTDGRIIGVIVFSSGLGFIMAKLRKNISKDSNLYIIILYIYYIQNIISSSYRIGTTSPEFWIIIIMCLILSKIRIFKRSRKK